MRNPLPDNDVPKRTLAAVVTSQIRQRIFDGTFAPGTPLNEVELAAQFRTSRGPVREGLQRLVQEGLLARSPHRAITVRVLTAEDFEDLYFARATIERAALIRLATRGVPASLIAELEQTLGRMSLAIHRQDWAQVSAFDLRFHEIAVYAAGSERLTTMYAQLAGQARLGLNILVGTYKGREDLLDEHQHLLRMVTTGNLPALIEALDAHFGDAMNTLTTHRDDTSAIATAHTHQHHGG